MDRVAAGRVPVMRAILVLAAVAAPAAASPLSLGLQLGVAPGEGSGLPVGAGRQLGFGLTGRYALAPWSFAQPAITFTAGTPIPGVGISAWGGLELRRRVAPHLSLSTTAGLRAGFAGPLYYARHSDVFVGYDYNFSGPLTVGPHLALGAVVSLGRVDAFAEVFAEAPLLPSPQLLFGGAAGFRIAL